jgi:hypothetical protein
LKGGKDIPSGCLCRLSVPDLAANKIRSNNATRRKKISNNHW